jgi:LCP family protein required for cell wall assembly
MLFTCSIALWLGFYAANPPETANILILGSDARPGSAEAEIARTDSIMVLGLNPQKQQVSLLSVPRDLFLTTPNYGLLRANTVLRNAELNFVGSGLEEMQGAIEETFEIEVDYYLRVNFEGFIAVVDALGGVTIEVPKHIIDYEYPTADYGTMVVEFQAGRQKMDGERALIYARTRHGDDDYQRAARQQQVMAALMSELTNPFNLPRWPAVVAAILDNSETNLTARQLFDLAPAILLYGNRPGLIEQLVIDRDYVTYGPNGEAIPHGPSLQPWVEAHLQ